MKGRRKGKVHFHLMRQVSSHLLFILLCTGMLSPSEVEAGKIGGGIGMFTLVGYQDVMVFYTPDRSHWIIGYRHHSGTERFEDPWSGEGITDTTETMTGPIVYYLFSNKNPRSFYVAASMYKWTLKEEALWTGSSDTDSAVAPFVGGGYFGWINDHAFYNIGMLFSVGTELKAEEEEFGNSSEGGGLDFQLIFGVAF